MKKSIKLTVYVLLMAGLVAWEFGSNRVMQRISGNLSVKNVSLSDYHTKDEVIFWLDEVQMMSDRYMTFAVSGWAFVETDEDNRDGWTDVLLVNDEHCYRLNEWPDVKPYQKNRSDVLSVYSDKKIPSDRVGFVTRHCGFEIENGKYEIYVYRYANEKNYGIGKSSAVLYKDGKSIELVYE